MNCNSSANIFYFVPWRLSTPKSIVYFLHVHELSGDFFYVVIIIIFFMNLKIKIVVKNPAKIIEYTKRDNPKNATQYSII